MMTLDNWSICSLTPYSAPEEGARVHGTVKGSNKFPDGSPIFTSRVEEVIRDADKVFVKTYSGSVYELLNVNPEYEVSFPDAKNRITI